MYNEKDYEEIEKNKEEISKEVYRYKGPNADKFRFTKVSLYSLTPYDHSETMIKNIGLILNLNKEKLSRLSIFECSCGIGGNTYQFIKYFDSVKGCERNDKQYELLKNNLEILDINAEDYVEKGEYSDFLDENLDIYYDIIFADPPWNFKNEKEMSHETIAYNENESIEETIDKLVDRAETIVLKTFYKDDTEIYKKYLASRNLNIVHFHISNTKIIVITKRKINYTFYKTIKNNSNKFDYKKFL